jgi:hypothetical protein
MSGGVLEGGALPFHFPQQHPTLHDREAEIGLKDLTDLLGERPHRR